MCGIVGFICKKKKLNLNLDNFLYSLSHRGPDNFEKKTINENQLFFASSRLSVVNNDENSNQPFQVKNGNILVFNGEIYNFKEIKEKLINYGYKFSTTSDTEVVLHAYDHWGKDCFEYFNGMWAIAIWDNKKKEVIFSRDQFGEKPLYYFQNQEFLAFSSELKSFSKLPKNIRPKINYDYLYKNKENISSGLTFYNKVFSFLPGHTYIITNLKDLKTFKWTTKLSTHNVSRNFEDNVEIYKNLLETSIKDRIPNKKFGVSFSGGLDSSSILSVLNKIRQDKKFEFSIYHFNQDEHENQNAKKLIKDLKLKNFNELDFSEINLDDIEKSIFFNESMKNDPGLGLWVIYKKMKINKQKVSLEGHGPDEYLGGYENFYYDYILDKYFLNFFLKKKDYISDFFEINENRNSDITAKFFLKNVLKKIFFLILNKSFLKEKIKTFTYGNVLQENLRDFDRLSMANSIEVRSPFLDYRLVKFVQNINDISIFFRSSYTKSILREAMTNLLPVFIRKDKKKIGFANKYNARFFSLCEKFIKMNINEKKFVENSHFDGKKVKLNFDKYYQTGENINLIQNWNKIKLYQIEKNY